MNERFLPDDYVACAHWGAPAVVMVIQRRIAVSRLLYAAKELSTGKVTYVPARMLQHGVWSFAGWVYTGMRK
jgi:hypothetical protein